MPRWTEEARRKQSEIQRARKSWRHSTGPKTEEGKKRASRNSLKHGMESEQTRRFKRLLKRDVKRLKDIKTLWRDSFGGARQRTALFAVSIRHWRRFAPCK